MELFRQIGRWAPPAALLLLAACGGEERDTEEGIAAPQNTAPQSSAEAAERSVPRRWYSPAQVDRGYGLFQEHCARCHRPDASGDPNWKQADATGRLPPPPLDGSAHTWHHPLPLLRQIVRNGGIPMGGSMPPFRDRLSADEIDAILAWVQSHWPDEIYAAWDRINRRKTP